jgi:hypothetical protein
MWCVVVSVLSCFLVCSLVLHHKCPAGDPAHTHTHTFSHSLSLSLCHFSLSLFFHRFLQYTLADDGVAEEGVEGDTDPGAVAASREWVLPAREFDGLWESLLYEVTIIYIYIYIYMYMYVCMYVYMCIYWWSVHIPHAVCHLPMRERVERCEGESIGVYGSHNDDGIPGGRLEYHFV